MQHSEASIEGVGILGFRPYADDRGTFIEVYRDEWVDETQPIQWNVVHSSPNTLRGVHVHVDHHDYLTVLSGSLLLGLHDIRPESPTLGLSDMIGLSAEQPRAILIPPGVCHGFYYLEPTIHLYAVSHYFNPADELGCRFDCPELNLAWPTTAPLLSRRDEAAGGYTTMREKYLSGHERAGRNPTGRVGLM